MEGAGSLWTTCLSRYSRSHKCNPLCVTLNRCRYMMALTGSFGIVTGNAIHHCAIVEFGIHCAQGSLNLTLDRGIAHDLNPTSTT